ncbi:hypothetical protein PFICI_06177 [Pestalotiopsis fici W106-1]|uniref:Uncharacterized protein n=1 Tax=Pestalotiopsis fici (strain W106-1 / CGMCC3.15140) TaxID=1229662 RepID=W3X539_PESFW|nr:uncharacterized protein PFICI_06177 [Pestalotiopsis fici W106-1]ETS81175.1 hypothetical protein PFICI_06177 [Pestalotiopsis fici W106-1]
MAKKSKKVSVVSSFDALPNVGSREVDPRPSCSPYTSTYIKVFFGANANAMKVPNELLQKCSNLPVGNIVLANSLHLTHIPEEVGHVLVHHLFTETFQCLAPKGSTHQEQKLDELMTCIHVYAVAWDYKLNSLKEQARSEIERLGESLPITPFLAALNKVYPHPSKDDIWLGGYLKDRMRALFAGHEVKKSTEPTSAGPKSSIAELVFHSALCLREEALELINGSNEHEPLSCGHVPEPDPKAELSSYSSEHEPEFACQDILPELIPVESRGYEAMPKPEPTCDNATPNAPQYGALSALAYDDEHVCCESKPDPDPVEESASTLPIMNDADPAEVLITSGEIPREYSVLEPLCQDETVFVPGSETDSSSPVFTPPSSTASDHSSNSAKIQRSEVEVPHQEETGPAAKKLSRLLSRKDKKSKKRRLREAQALQEPELNDVCESMSQHLKLGGEWKDCEFCRKLVDGLAAEL